MEDRDSKIANFKMKKLISIYVTLFHICFYNIAYAYIEPATISYIFSIMAAGIIGVLIQFKFIYFKIIKTLEKLNLKKKREHVEINDEEKGKGTE